MDKKYCPSHPTHCRCQAYTYIEKGFKQTGFFFSLHTVLNNNINWTYPAISTITEVYGTEIQFQWIFFFFRALGLVKWLSNFCVQFTSWNACGSLRSKMKFRVYFYLYRTNKGPSWLSKTLIVHICCQFSHHLKSLDKRVFHVSVKMIYIFLWKCERFLKIRLISNY